MRWLIMSRLIWIYTICQSANDFKYNILLTIDNELVKLFVYTYCAVGLYMSFAVQYGMVTCLKYGHDSIV